MRRIKPNCGPASVAHLLEKPVDDVMALFKQLFPKRYGAHQWQGRSWPMDCKAVLEKHGKLERVKDRGSVKKFAENACSAKGLYFIMVGDHFMAIKGQQIFDNWFEGADPADCKWSKKRVQLAFRFYPAA